MLREKINTRFQDVSALRCVVDELVQTAVSGSEGCRMSLLKRLAHAVTYRIGCLELADHIESGQQPSLSVVSSQTKSLIQALIDQVAQLISHSFSLHPPEKWPGRHTASICGTIIRALDDALPDSVAVPQVFRSSDEHDATGLREELRILRHDLELMKHSPFLSKKSPPRPKDWNQDVQVALN